MRNLALAVAATLALAACSTSPHSLAPDTAQGPTSYVCYSNLTSNPEDVRAIGERQCRKSGYGISSMLGQSWTPLRCGFLTPSVVAFQCGSGYSSMPSYMPPMR
ncbi:MAG: hypothetical protein HQL42_09170 [Alphaproteobacteria bacterium]|nr:hypothetical protein [Alphaproteobacteria bacterium]